MPNRKDRRAFKKNAKKFADEWAKNVYRPLADDEVDYVMSKTYYRVGGLDPDEVQAIRNGKYEAQGEARVLLNLFQRVYGPRVSNPIMPKTLYTGAQRGDYTSEDLQMMLAPIWTFAGHPGTLLDADKWTWLFRQARYFDLIEYGKEPPETLRLYRGAIPGTENNHAWTTSRVMAEAFARKRGAEGRMFTTVATADHLLARYPHFNIGDEWIVDTTGLDIQPASPQFTTKLVYKGMAPAALLEAAKSLKNESDTEEEAA